MDKKTSFMKYTPSLIGKIAICIAAPAALIGIVAVFFAFFTPEAFMLTLYAEAVAIIGSIVILIDIVVFNIKQKKNMPNNNEPKTIDIMRAVHMLIGIGVGIMIGYLIWH